VPGFAPGIVRNPCVVFEARIGIACGAWCIVTIITRAARFPAHW
jgi:hypothetical protein